MPNGGSDCCGPCWFNTRNQRPIRLPLDDPEPHNCGIRGLRIDDPYWTYCANQMQHRPDRDVIPIGPVYIAGEETWRDVWVPSPDTEEIRIHLLALLDNIEQTPGPHSGMDGYVERIVMWQLGEFREPRAVSGLRRVAGFRPEEMAADPHNYRRDILPEIAADALEKIAAA